MLYPTLAFVLPFAGEMCEPTPSRTAPLPTSLVDGFEGGVGANWASVTGGAVGLGCSSLAPYAHGKHLYFSGCGMRQARTVDLDTRTARYISTVLVMVPARLPLIYRVG